MAVWRHYRRCTSTLPDAVMRKIGMIGSAFGRYRTKRPDLGRAAVVGVSELVSEPKNGNDDFETGFGIADRGQASQGRSRQLGIRNTIVFETGRHRRHPRY